MRNINQQLQQLYPKDQRLAQLSNLYPPNPHKPQLFPKQYNQFNFGDVGFLASLNVEVDLGVPDTISGLVSLWDASVIDTITKDGSDRVSQWNDRKGTNHLVQATGADQPLWLSADQNSLDIINMQSDRWMDSAFSTISQPFTLCLALDMTDNGTAGFVSDSYATSATATEIPSTNDFFRMDAGVNLQNTLTSQRGTWLDIFYKFDGSTSVCVVDDNNVLSGNAGTNALTDGLVIATSLARTAAGNIKTGEILLYNKKLSVTEVNTLETYFNSKWAV